MCPRAILTALLFTSACARAPEPALPLEVRDASSEDAFMSNDDAAPAIVDAGREPPPDASLSADAGVQREPMLLEATSGKLTLDGRPIVFRGAISCCGGGYGWPIVDEAWINYVAARSTNFLHVRLGPFLTGDGAETEWASTGGGYVTTGELADLDQFNEAFWSRLNVLLQLAQDRRIWVEVDIVDGWAIRHCRRGDIPGYSAWSADNNLQHQNECAAAGQGEIVPGSVQDLWVRKVVRETGRFDNVIYQDGNEIGLLGNYDPAWSTSMAAIIRDEETSNAHPRHLFATNSERLETIEDPAVDYVELHGSTPADPALCAGKPCLVNEYNPDPPLTPQQITERYCTALEQGTYFWYWRHGQEQSAMDETLALIEAGCP